MVNRMSPPTEGQGKVSAVKGIDNEGNLQTV